MRGVHWVCLGVLLAGGVGPVAWAGPIDPALERTQDWIATSNLVNHADAEVQIKLDLARRKRDEHDFDQAARTLVTLLGEAPAGDWARTALLELALTAQQAGQLARAVQVLAQYVERFPEDASVPEVLLRQGLIYREMGAHSMALSKFYAVMTTVLNLKLDGSGHNQRLVLQAQTEIADTHYLEGRYGEAADCFERLLKLDAPNLNREQIELKLLRCYSAAKRHDDVIRQAEGFLQSHAAEPEARFLLAESLQAAGRKADAVGEAMRLLEGRGATAWKQRVGNVIGNRLYASGDYTNALLIYRALEMANSAPQWRVPVAYQIGLTHERLAQREQAVAAYADVLERGTQLGGNVEPNLKTVLDMAAWRKNYLAWQPQAKEALQTLRQISPPAALH